MNQKLPHHVAIVMDGNGRWAENKGFPRIEGHRQGVKTVKSIVQHCVKRKIKILSIFAFSSENWARPEEEVAFLMQLFLQSLEKEIQELHQQGVQLLFPGDRSRLSPVLRAQMEQAEVLTAANQTLILNVAMNYGGKWDILQAAKSLTKQVLEGKKNIDLLEEADFDQLLNTAPQPNPDLFIRTSGEQRISNFFLWQLAYTELFFTDIHWPDFTTAEFDKALENYAARQRRYGLIEQQAVEREYV